MEVGDVYDTPIMEEVEKAVNAALGVKALTSPPKDAKTIPYLVMQRSNTLDTDMFRKTLQLQFMAVSDKFPEAHSMGNKIVDAVNTWAGTTDLNIMGHPLLNGLNDGDTGTGQYVTTIDVQIPYLAA